MAISEVHFRLLCELRDLGTFSPGGNLLEIGEANVYGDFEPEVIIQEKFEQTGCQEILNGEDQFKLARMVYDATIKPAHRDAIDMHGQTSIKANLNEPIQFDRSYETVINHGTAEHIFNIGQVFQTMHEACAVGGVMIHESPFTGWIDHGFYSLQPTLFYDLAHANSYRIELLGLEEISGKTFTRIHSREAIGKLNGKLPKNANLFVVFRKLFDNPFRVPMQAVYAGTASESVVKAWYQNR